jgi:hypothetical protein
MRRLFLAASALTLCTLAACGRHEPPTNNSSISAGSPQPSATASAPPARPLTQASAASNGDGAYGMPHAPIPYSELDAYERQQQGRQDPSMSGQPDQPGQPPAPPRTRTSKPRSADTVFY